MGDLTNSYNTYFQLPFRDSSGVEDLLLAAQKPFNSLFGIPSFIVISLFPIQITFNSLFGILHRLRTVEPGDRQDFQLPFRDSDP